MSSDDRAEADVQGDLAQYPLPRLIFYLYKKQFLGQLHLDRPQGDKAKVYFRQGMPAFVELRAMEDVLARVLLERGWITTEQFELSLAGLAQGEKLHGHLLLEMGAIDARQLVNGLRLQLRRKLNRLFQLKEGAFALYGGDHDYGKDSEGEAIQVDPLWVIHQGVLNAFDSSRLAPELRKLDGCSVQLRTEFVPHLGRFGLSPEEMGLAQVLIGRAVEVERVFQLGHLSRMQAEMLLYTLWVTEALTLSEGASVRPPARPDERPATAPDIQTLAAGFASPATQAVSKQRPAQRDGAPARAAPPQARPPAEAPTKADAPEAGAGERRKDRPELRQLRAEIQRRLARLAQQNHFEVLGVERGASSEVVRDAYFKLAKEFHPDRVSGMGLEPEATREAEALFSRIAEANAVLSDARARADYEKSLDQPEGAADEARALLDAEMTFQRATVFFRKRDYRQALEQFEEAYRLNDREGEHLAWIAWTRWNDPKGDKKALLPQLLKDLKRAIQISPRRPQSHYFLGELQLAAGEEKRAMESFEKVIEINPSHVDALRQIRLMGMRQERADKKPTGAVKALSRFLKKQ